MLFDSHAHLDDNKFDLDREEVINRFLSVDGQLIINAGVDIKSSKKALYFAEKYPFIYATAGIHPSETEKFSEENVDILKKLLSYKKCVALGEIGLDYHYDTPAKDVQKYWFERQLEIAKEFNLPVVIHDRDAHEDCFNLVKKHGNSGVFHCYSGSLEMAKELIKLGFYLSFSGVVTFKNARRGQNVVQNIPIEKILIETDCPYLAPEPNRGKRNEPAFIQYTAKKIAEIKGLSYEELIKITNKNALNCYHISI